MDGPQFGALRTTSLLFVCEASLDGDIQLDLGQFAVVCEDGWMGLRKGIRSCFALNEVLSYCLAH